jgi:folate-binding protein YgfZ
VTTPAFVVERVPWGLVVARGTDATTFLQSLLSQDLDPLTVGDAAPTLLLTPQGKLDVAFRVVHTDADEWSLDTDPAFAARLLASLTRFRIRVKVELEDQTATTALATVVGSDVDAPPGVRALPTRWGPHAGTDLLGPAPLVHDAVAALPKSLARWDAERFDAFRIEVGVPRLGVDVDDSTIPQEAFLERDAVSFTKGCFIGQELVCRIDTRGHVNRYLRGVHIAGSTPPPVGATIVVDGRDRGVVTSAAAVPGEDRVVGLAMVRREVEPPTPIQVHWDGGDLDAELVSVDTP